MKRSKTTRYHLTPTRMAVTEKTKLIGAGGDVERGEHLCTVGGMQIGSTTMVNSMKF